MQEKNIAVQFIRNFTIEGLGGALCENAIPAGLNVASTFGAYDNVIPEVLAIASAQTPPDYLIVTLDLEFFAGGLYNPHWHQKQIEDELGELLEALRQVPPQTFIFLSTFLPPFQMPLPNVPGHPVLGRAAAAFRLNQMIRDFAAGQSSQCIALDFERIAARLGETGTLDRRFALMMKAPLRQGFMDEAAKEVLRVIRCRETPPKKVLVLDCDNTLWGGVVGELGVDGIALDPYEYPGIAYYRFQFEILALAETGVLLCLCSKNDEAAVWEVLERHPHCLIKREHLVGHRINWSDKASNLQSLAKELSLSTDAMVFVDDNPVECELVRSTMPEITVFQVPSKIYQLPGSLQAQGWFDRLVLNQEDKDRTRYYQAEQGRRDVQKRHDNPESFLQDLQMRAVVRRLELHEIARASQLCQRTNQFNLTTRRYTESEITALHNDQAARIYTLQAADRFGPVGLSGLIIYKKQDDCTVVDTFLLSCRIIGRQFDRALLCESARLLSGEWEVREWLAHYLPTPKNNVVSTLWSEYGFLPAPEAGEGSYRWPNPELPLQPPTFIQITDTL